MDVKQQKTTHTQTRTHTHTEYINTSTPFMFRGGRVVRGCGVNFHCRGVLPTWITVGQGPIVLAVGAGEGCLDIFSLIYHFSFLSPSLWETARYRLKYCLKGPLSPNQPNQPTNHLCLPNLAPQSQRPLWEAL